MIKDWSEGDVDPVIIVHESFAQFHLASTIRQEIAGWQVKYGSGICFQVMDRDSTTVAPMLHELDRKKKSMILNSEIVSFTSILNVQSCQIYHLLPSENGGAEVQSRIDLIFEQPSGFLDSGSDPCCWDAWLAGAAEILMHQARARA